ncbi:MAG TPA: tetratricopeptide repeat protein [Bryobacteraceae bacterium]|nr:tetratricopeptide repeat protein [Bryobacteraceae bacterium]
MAYLGIRMIQMWALAWIGLAAASGDVQESYRRGEQALAKGDLTEAAASFQQVLALQANDPGAHANLGVIYMRRKQWKSALVELRMAERLAPTVAGVRLNIGLVYYRQSEFAAATPLFESVVRDMPGSTQASYLLGLCYLFQERHADAVRVLEPLWDQEAGKFPYLYVLAVAAGNAGQADLEERALKRMLEIGNDSTEYHMVIGKACLQRADNDRAILELERAGAMDGKRPLVHYFLGVAYRRHHDLERAKQEFQKDVALEPQVAFNYDQLGAVSWELGQYDEAYRYYREALRLDSHLASSAFGLARFYRQREKYPQALAALDTAGTLDPTSASVHYMRGQILVRVGRKEEGRKELAIAARMLRAATDRLEREVSGASFLDPQLAMEPN